MKRNLSLWLAFPAVVGLMVFALPSAPAQQAPAADMGKVHGHVTNPTGEPQGGGSVSLSTDGGNTLKFTFPVDTSGNYSGEATPGTYMAVYRAPDTPPGKMVDDLPGVKVVAGQDVEANLDMSRQAYIDKMPEEQRKQLEELKQKNAEAMKANVLINHLNADLKVVDADQKDIDGASQAAAQQLGASAQRADIDAKANEIRAAKYADIESMMTTDTQAMPTEALLWVKLGYAQNGEKKYDDAVTSYKKAIDLEQAAKKPRLEVIGVAEAGLGEVYARTGKVPEANAAYDAAAKDDPTRAGIHLRNEAVIFFQEHNTTAQVDAANEAIKIDPNDPILYYIKGQGLIQNATIDPKTNRIVLPDDCTAAYQKYLDLDPHGQFADEVAGILQQAGQKINSSYRAPKGH
ncbi:MAG TPA: carboxypeptidase-like regulatory domain-containing protein [Terracidiphilus sp.]|nr:carboxypeptidase-like regulatory domain-containing protein [Terracidiphilus sp.]